MEELIKRLERVISTGAPDKDGMHPISAETVLEVVNELSEHSTNLASLGTDCSEFPNNSDTISRQAAIEAVQNRHMMLNKEKVLLINDLEKLPSAQPEIIRCRECKFASGDSRICMKFDHSPIGELDFCSFAERREVQDENDKTTNNTTNA